MIRDTPTRPQAHSHKPKDPPRAYQANPVCIRCPPQSLELPPVSLAVRPHALLSPPRRLKVPLLLLPLPLQLHRSEPGLLPPPPAVPFPTQASRPRRPTPARLVLPAWISPSRATIWGPSSSVSPWPHSVSSVPASPIGTSRMTRPIPRAD